MAAVAERHESLVTAFEAFRGEPAFAAAPQSREWAFRRFLERGFPTTHDEEWKFTSVAPIAETTWVRAEAVKPTPSDVNPFRLEGLPAIVIVNGRYAEALSALELPEGVTVDVSREHQGNTAQTAFADLNGAFYEDVVRLVVAAHAIVETPIHVLVIAAAGERPAVVAPRLVISAGERSQCAIVEEYASLGSGVTLTAAVTDLVLGPGAVVEHVKIQRESMTAFHMGSQQAELHRSSTLASRALTFGGRIARNDIGAALRGEGAECTLNGLYVATGHRLVDTHTTIDHAMPHCPSHEVYKGILAGRARAVFNGKIIVRPQAQKTDAKQTNKALLLSDDAQINTKPQLEIFADDVKCTHGAAIGQLDEDAFFYLRARGVAEADARHMLIEAFVGEILDGISIEPARARGRALLESSLAHIAHG
jgi:Fe-S cluster assembly protein SufD